MSAEKKQSMCLADVINMLDNIKEKITNNEYKEMVDAIAAINKTKGLERHKIQVAVPITNFDCDEPVSSARSVEMIVLLDRISDTCYAEHIKGASATPFSIPFHLLERCAEHDISHLEVMCSGDIGACVVYRCDKMK